MLKRIAILCAAMILAPIALANGGMPAPAPMAPSVYSGFHVGGALNWAKTFADVQYKEKVAGANTEKYYNGTMTGGFTLLGSYGHVFNRAFLLGAVAHARYLLDNSKWSVDNVSQERAKLHQDWNFNLSAQFGWLPAMFHARNVMLYALLGVELGRFHFQKAKYDSSPNVYGKNSSAWLWGFAPGVGISAEVFHNFTLGAQYVATFFAKHTFTDPTNAARSVKTDVTNKNIITNVFSVIATYKLPWNI